jgi:predicted permease
MASKPSIENLLFFIRTKTGMVLETLLYLPLNHLKRLLAREYFIELTSGENFKLYITYSLSPKKQINSL